MSHYEDEYDADIENNAESDVENDGEAMEVDEVNEVNEEPLVDDWNAGQLVGADKNNPASPRPTFQAVSVTMTTRSPTARATATSGLFARTARQTQDTRLSTKPPYTPESPSGVSVPTSTGTGAAAGACSTRPSMVQMKKRLLR